jgi:hypothetical protein
MPVFSLINFVLWSSTLNFSEKNVPRVLTVMPAAGPPTAVATALAASTGACSASISLAAAAKDNGFSTIS